MEGGRPAEQPSADLDETIGAVEKLPSESLAAASTLAEDQRLNLLIYFDNLFLKPFSRNKVIGELLLKNSP